MAFKGSPHFKHGQSPKVGVLVTNLGTPDAPTPKALRRYLKEFLSDPRVVEIPKPIWWLILNGIILNTRPKKSAHAYQSVWTERGSPLLFHTQDQAKALAARFAAEHGDQVEVAFAMRYGNPGISEGIQGLMDKGVDRLLVLPLYPQYCASTSASTLDKVSDDLRRRRWLPDLRFVSHYHDFGPYIEALAQSIEQHWQAHGRADKLVLSYHGIPKRNLLLGDPYFCECHKTSRLLRERLGLGEDEVLTTFQSRFGKAEWLKPYTDATLKQLARDGVKSVQLACPGFSADCLETIEEIGVENRGYFLEAGGERYEYIAALNASPGHIDALYQLLRRELQGWLEKDTDRAETAQLAQALGAQS
ncbi:ferrochelatase [Gallaecimonas xiamenensis]|uniref:Ferrochelatase n=1 Tax=Gallaecimonas xiamenensis 3-C-1 TaxID=745411 RepID=K2J114_9GAMM|nr:ferrochelatase [Gallaecimonas xiamenensis]EKE68763.1 ferrochelatase [Gallaecimonas xiamenensis 3-C-1]